MSGERTTAKINIANKAVVSDCVIKVVTVLDTLVAEQKAMAHNAIDIADWQQCQTLLVTAINNISSLNAWKMRINELRGEMLASALLTGGVACKAEVEELSTAKPSVERHPGPEMASNVLPDMRGNPEMLVLLGEEHKISGWSEAIVKICEDMELRKPYAMALIDVPDSRWFTRNESVAKTQMELPQKLHNGLWVETARTGIAVCEFIYNLIERCGYAPSDLRVGKGGQEWKILMAD